jgi:hypothetical protein
MTTKTETQYQHLEPRPGSNYRQLFLKGRRIRTAVVEESIHGPDPRTLPSLQALAEHQRSARIRGTQHGRQGRSARDGQEKKPK